MAILTISELFEKYPLSSMESAPADAWRKPKGMTPARMFAELAEIEPRLKLLKEARRYKREAKGKERVCANDLWYGTSAVPYDETMKGRLEKLVGWFTEAPRLRTEDAYDVAYDFIYQALPYYRGCWCM